MTKYQLQRVNLIQSPNAIIWHGFVTAKPRVLPHPPPEIRVKKHPNPVPKLAPANLSTVLRSYAFPYEVRSL